MAERLLDNVYVFIRGYGTQINTFQHFIVAPFKTAELEDRRVIADILGTRLTAHDVRPRIRCLFLQGQQANGSSWYAMVDLDKLDDRSIYLLWSTLLKIPVWIGHDLAVECAWIVSSGYVDIGKHLNDLPVLLDLQLMVMVFRPLTFYLLHTKAVKPQHEISGMTRAAEQDAAILDEFSAPEQNKAGNESNKPTIPSYLPRHHVIYYDHPILKRLAQSTDGNPQHSIKFSLEDLYLTIKNKHLTTTGVNNSVKKYGIAWSLPDILPEHIDSAFAIIDFIRDILFNVSTSGLMENNSTFKAVENHVNDLVKPNIDSSNSDILKSNEILMSIIRVLPFFERLHEFYIPSRIEQATKNVSHDHIGKLYANNAISTWMLGFKHKNGLPMSPSRIEQMIEYETSNIVSMVKKLQEAHEFLPVLSNLFGTNQGEDVETLTAFADYIYRSRKKLLKRNTQGQWIANNNDLVLMGLHRDPLVAAFIKLRKTKSNLRLLSYWFQQSRYDAKLHVISSWSARTGRASTPGDYSIPSDKLYRSCFISDPGESLISVDYHAMEMVIAAELSARSMHEFQSGYKKSHPFRENDFKEMHKHIVDRAKWYMQFSLYAEAEHATTSAGLIKNEGPILKNKLFSYHAKSIDKLAWFWSRIQISQQSFGYASKLAEALKCGVDMHVLTGCSMQNPAWYSILEDMKSMSPEDTKALREKLTEPGRQAGKAANYGLMYGIGGASFHEHGIHKYELDWSRAESDAAIVAWFDLFPELGFWQEWSLLTYRSFAAKGVKWVPSQGGILAPATGGPMPTPTTLSNRYLYATTKYQILSYQNQGTGAEIAWAATAGMDALKRYFVEFKHDQWIFQSPDGIAKDVGAQAKAIAEHAAGLFLHHVSMRADVSISKVGFH
jgi:hypothetical protein